MQVFSSSCIPVHRNTVRTRTFGFFSANLFDAVRRIGSPKTEKALYGRYCRSSAFIPVENMAGVSRQSALAQRLRPIRSRFSTGINGMDGEMLTATRNQSPRRFRPATASLLGPTNQNSTPPRLLYAGRIGERASTPAGSDEC